MHSRRGDPPWAWVGLVAVLLAAAVSMRATRPVAAGAVGGGTIGLRIDVNHAGVEALELLPQIGPALARRIVQRRQEAGGYVTVDALDDVRGIGPKTLAGVRGWVVCGPDATADDEHAAGLR